MGQAKSRGSYEVRKAEGEVNAALAEAERKKQSALYEASLTPEQKQKRREFEQLVALATGFAAEYFRF